MLFVKRPPALKRILIVEDEALVAFDNEHFLTDTGFEVVGTVDSVAAAVSAIAAEDIDLVLVDIRLSDGSGLDVAHAAQARGIPVLFVTASCPGEAKALAIGCLAKPYSQRDLRASIDAVGEVLAGRKVGRKPRGLKLFGG